MSLFTLAIALGVVAPTPWDYSGLPMLKSPNPYRILTSTTNIDLQKAEHGGGPGSIVIVTSTTVYRNQGAAGQATLTIPRHRVGGAGAGAPDFQITATWDNQPVTFQAALITQTGSGEAIDVESDLTATVPIRSQGTHALRITCQEPLQQTGYGSVQYRTGYLLTGENPIEQMNVNYRYPPQVVFDLPTAKPDLGWQKGAKGVTIRKSNFVPAGQLTNIEFYPAGFKPIG